MTDTNRKSGCLSVIFPFLKRSKRTLPPDALPDELQDDFLTPIALPYRLRDDFLSPAEFSFFKVLSLLVSPRLSIQSKVRMADIFFVSRPNKNFAYFNRIAQKHLDFLVCDSVTMKPLFGVELDDSSHRRNNRQMRDEFVESVCEVAGFPLLRLPAQNSYNSREIAAQIAPFFPDIASVNGSYTEPQPEENQQDSSLPLCPKCSIPMVLRTVSKGQHIGKKFYGCRNFPSCRQMKPA